jgi:hypothetical protein
MTRSKLIPLALAVAVVSPTAAASAAIKNPQPDAAMRKAVRDYADHGIEGKKLKASDARFSCTAIPKVNDKGRCTGTFKFTYKGKTATYKLTSKATTFRISPGAIEYHLNAQAIRKAAGLPSHIGTFAGFLQ